MLGLRTGEILFIGFILVVVFSASRMGQLGNAVGKFVYSFRKASKGNDFVDVKPLPPSSRRGTTDEPSATHNTTRPSWDWTENETQPAPLQTALVTNSLTTTAASSSQASSRNPHPKSTALTARRAALGASTPSGRSSWASSSLTATPPDPDGGTARSRYPRPGAPETSRDMDDHRYRAGWVGRVGRPVSDPW
jgi:sec-independent protein translocase protein TatA